ncbi:hypothetical protein D9M71_597010 [compost metagenome]
MAGQAQRFTERLKGLLWLLEAVQCERQENLQLQFAAVMLPVPRLLDRRAQGLGCRRTFTLDNAQALSGDTRGVHVVGDTDEIGTVPVADKVS